jgi:hypothetical protein
LRTILPLNLDLFARWRGRAEPFLIFALARTGSTTLRRLLQCHPAISCLHEPFNPERRNPPETVSDAARLRQEVREIRKKYSGIKHVWDTAGWPFPKGSALNQELLMQPDQRILFLNRRNVLRRLVSHQIAVQVDAWGMDDQDRTALRERPLVPLDTEALGHFLAREQSAIAEHRRVIVESGNPFLDLWYEDLFDAGTPLEGREAKLARIFAFLGLKPVRLPKHLDRVRLLFDPEDGPLNSAATYRRIPGIDDVEARFGSDSTGHLFR